MTIRVFPIESSVCMFRDNWGRRLCHVVAMDAICFSNPCDQYTFECIGRELIKAFTCFRLPRSYEKRVYGIATGNWGCGAFRGDKELKGRFSFQ